MNQQNELTSNKTVSAMMLIWLLATMFLWFLAFYNPGLDSESWIVRAQAVCFGTSASGLPDTYGWFVLILAPLSFLIAMLVTYFQEVINMFKAIKSSRIALLPTLLLLGVLMFEGHWLGTTITSRVRSARASYDFQATTELPEGYPRINKQAAELNLIDQNGEVISLESLKGHTTLLTFAFAHCQTICPAIVKNVQSARKELNDDAVKVVIVTLDPWRDTPSSLKRLAAKWKLGKNEHILSGKVPEVLSVLDAYNIPRVRDEKTGDVTHPAIVNLLSPEGQIVYAFNNPFEEWLVEGTKRIQSF